MERFIPVESDMKPIAYAWPGGYPVFYLARSGWKNEETGELELNQYDKSEFVICPSCAGTAKDNDAILIAYDINYEDDDLYCEVCEERIESAYGEGNKDEWE